MTHDVADAPASDLPGITAMDWLNPLRDTCVDPGALPDRVAPCAKDFREEFVPPDPRVHRHITHRRRATP